MHQTPTRAALVAGALVAAVGVLGACSPDEPAAVLPTAPSPTPTVDEAEQQDAEAAEKLLRDFYALDAKIASNGYDGWQVMAGFWNAEDEWANQQATYKMRAAEGWRAEGGAEIASLEVTEHDPGKDGAGDERVTVEVCNDTGGVVVYDGDGKKAARAEGAPERFIVTYTLATLDGEGRWAITGRTADLERSC